MFFNGATTAITNNQKLDIYNHDGEYIPLAKVPATMPFYGPANTVHVPEVSKHQLLQLYIGGVSVLGFIVLYRFFQKS
jgi:hypothetical protein